jgi:hypothetical protein
MYTPISSTRYQPGHIEAANCPIDKGGRKEIEEGIGWTNK